MSGPRLALLQMREAIAVEQRAAFEAELADLLARIAHPNETVAMISQPGWRDHAQLTGDDIVLLRDRAAVLERKIARLKSAAE